MGVSATKIASAADKELAHRWVYLATNLLVDKNVEEAVALLERSAKAGYNGVVLTDSKFMRWDSLDAKYLVNVRKVRAACTRLKLECVVAVCPIGYSNDLLGRDPNLAEGLPVVDAPFVLKGGKFIPADDSCQLANGDFEQASAKNPNMPAGWSFVDEPGKITFIDKDVKSHGQASLRMQDIDKVDPANGHGRAHQELKVQPFRYYHVSAMVKTEDFAAAGEVRIAVLAGKDTLNFYQPEIAKTQDWKRVDIVFDSLDHDKVNFYLGVWGGKGGKIWWDDVKLESAGIVNVLRRAGAPFVMKTADGKTTLTEGKDYDNAKDPKLGMVPWAGGFRVWPGSAKGDEVPLMTTPATSKVKEGETVLCSYYFPPVIQSEQVMCCMCEPKLYEILDWQIGKVKEALAPDGYFLQHDEIRCQGWDESCKASGKTPGQILADNVKQCIALVRKHDPGKPIYAWSDMFDPLHNAAKAGPYYLVKGDGPWTGSWEGLPKDVIVVNWHGHNPGRLDSLKFFADRGNPQILAGYYDGDPKAILPWLADARQAGGLVGVMYTTWQHKFDDLERFAELLGK
jgi:hypothetical protein